MKTATGDLVGYAQIVQPRRPQPTPRPEKKGRDMKRARQINVAVAGLEGFMDWAGILANESVEEEEMSMLAIGFAARMQKLDADLEDEPTLIPDRKRPKRSSPDEEVEKDWAIILVDSPDQASNDQLVLEGAPNEDSAPQEEGIPAGGPSVDEIHEGSPSG